MRIEARLANSTCPSCQQIVGSPRGAPVTPHQKPDGSREQCQGGIGQ